MKKVLIVDDSELWIKQGKMLLEQYRYEVAGFVVSDPKRFTSDSLPESVAVALKEVDVLLIDKDLGEAVTSTPLICVVRHNFPKLPIVRWTGGHGFGDPYMKLLGVTNINKPNKKNEAEFVQKFEKALHEQELILFCPSRPMEVFATLVEATEPDRHGVDQWALRIRQIGQIAQLAHRDCVNSDNRRYRWTITGDSAGTTKHELGHCICDGVLSVEDIRPFLTDLQMVITKFEEAGEIDNRFKYCAEFIKAGNLDELELVRHCY